MDLTAAQETIAELRKQMSEGNRLHLLDLTRMSEQATELRNALDMATQGKYSQLMLDLAEGRAKQISAGLEICALKGELTAAQATIASRDVAIDHLNDGLEAAEAELKELRADLDVERLAYKGCDSERNELKAKLLASEKDAERYRTYRNRAGQPRCLDMCVDPAQKDLYWDDAALGRKP